jgi:peptidoglycan/LPS O-acetylase OafA/YrhL
MGTLRFLLACSVVLAHSQQFFGFYGMGGNAVPAFFVISGFYMQMILLEKYNTGRGVFLFYTNRFLRLYPLYWATLFLWVLAAQIPFSGWPWSHIASGAGNSLGNAVDFSYPALVAVIPNLTFIGADFLRLFIVAPDSSFYLWSYGLQESEGWRGAYHWIVNPPIWSLGVEITFYAFVPFIAMRSTKFLLLLALFFVCVHFYIWSLTEVGWRHLISPYCFIYFLIGMLAWRAPAPKSRLKFILILFPFILWTFWQILPSLSGVSGRFLEISLFALFSFCLKPLFIATKNFKIDTRLGAYSYPIYLVHMLFAWPMTTLGNWAGPAAILCSMFVSWLLLKLVDTPVDRWRQARVKNH